MNRTRKFRKEQRAGARRVDERAAAPRRCKSMNGTDSRGAEIVDVGVRRRCGRDWRRPNFASLTSRNTVGRKAGSGTLAVRLQSALCMAHPCATKAKPIINSICNELGTLLVTYTPSSVQLSFLRRAEND